MGCILGLNTKVSLEQVSIKGADPDKQGETSIGGTGKQVKVNTNLVLLFLLAKADHCGRLAIPTVVGLIQLFNFKFYQLKFEF